MRPAKTNEGAALSAPYVDSLMTEWGPWRSRSVRTCMSSVLAELSSEALLVLRRNPRLEVVRSLDKTDYSIWAYFPIHSRRHVARQYKPRQETQVLIVINESLLKGQPLEQSKAQLRDHLGHTMLYLRSPRASNECADAMREWRQNRVRSLVDRQN